MDLEGEQRTKSFVKKVDAQRFAEETNSAILRNEYVDPRLSRVTILDLYEEWEPTTTVAPKTRYTRSSTWRNHLLPKWGRRPASSIKKHEVQTWISESHRDGKSRALIQQSLALLRLILKHAVETNRILVNPADGVTLPREGAKERDYLTVRQVQALADAVGEHYSPLILILALTGLRFGEASALRVKDVDFPRSRLEVSRAFSDVGGKLVEGLPKTHRARSVAFPPLLREGLEKSVRHKKPADLVFTTLEGYVLRNENFRRRVFIPAREEAGKILGAPSPRFRFMIFVTPRLL